MRSDRREWPGELDLLEGLYPPERDVRGPFVWARGTFRIRRRETSPYVRADICYYGDEGQLSFSDRSGRTALLPLARGWHTYALDFSEGWSRDLDCEISSVIPVRGDPRELGVMLRPARALATRADWHLLRDMGVNKTLNEKEFQQGRTVLESIPPRLRVDIETRCNLRPRCNYCEWEWNKELERAAPADFRVCRPEDMGDFYRLAGQVVDCGYGEPLLHPEIGAFLTACDRDHKHVELTSNGTLLDERRRAALVGRELTLYVSLDAATAETYGLYRSADFRLIMENLRALCRERRASGGLPTVVMSFIAMRSNLTELESYFRLMADAGVDAVKLRQLYSDFRSGTVTSRTGGFDYFGEMLSPDEFREAAFRAHRAARECGLELILEANFCAEFGGGGVPICSEPWSAIYVLARGVMPCCFGKDPIVAWTEMGERPLHTFLGDVFNGPAYRKLRSALAAGRLPEYCATRSSCPIVKRLRGSGHDR